MLLAVVLVVAQPTADIDLTGTWRLVQPKGPLVRFLGNSSAVYDESGQELIRSASLSGGRFLGEIRIRTRQTKVETWTTFTLELKEEGEVLEGTYENKEKVDENKFEVVPPPVPLKLVRTCRPIRGPLHLGTGDFRVSIQLSEPIKKIKREDDLSPRDGHCHYAGIGMASLQVATGGPGALAFPLSITNADLSFYIKKDADPEDPKAFRDVTVTWSDSETGAIPTPKLLNVSFHLYSLAVTFDVKDDGSMSLRDGTLEIRMQAGRDVQLLGPVYLGGGVSAIVSWKWNDGARAWTQGEWSFGGLSDVEFQVRREGTITIASLRLEVGSTGEILSRLQLVGARTWSMAGFEVELSDCTLEAEINIPRGTWRILRGAIRGKVRPRAPAGSEFAIVLEWVKGGFELKIDSTKPFEIFGGRCSRLSVTALLDQNTLEFRTFDGSMAWKHPRFGAGIDIQRFLLEDGELKQFLGSGRVRYDGSFDFDISRLEYDGTVLPSRLMVSARLELGWEKVNASADIEEFVILESGEIPSFKLKSGVNAAPIRLNLEAKYETGAFRGAFDGKLAGTIGIRGKVAVGKQRDPEYAYGALEIGVELGRGIPIGNTGLVVVGLGGGVGCNYIFAGSPLAPDGKAVGAEGPRRDTFFLAGDITIGDAAGLATLKGRLAIYLGRDTAFQISGTVQVTRSTPYFRGELTCSYVLGSGEVKGTIGCTVQIPTSGAVLRTNQNTLVYSMGNGRWSLAGRNLGGQLFGALTLYDGSIDVGGRIGGDGIEGSVRGAARGGVNWAVERTFVVTFVGSLRVDLMGRAALRLSQGGIEAEGELEGYARGALSITTPAVWVFDAHTYAKEVTARGRLAVSNRGSRLRVAGTMEISTLSGVLFDTDFSYEW